MSKETGSANHATRRAERHAGGPGAGSGGAAGARVSEAARAQREAELADGTKKAARVSLGGLSLRGCANERGA